MNRLSEKELIVGWYFALAVVITFVGAIFNETVYLIGFGMLTLLAAAILIYVVFLFLNEVLFEPTIYYWRKRK